MKLKGAAFPSNVRILHSTGVPWVILKPTKQYKSSRPNSVARINHPSEPPLLTIPSNKGGSQSSQTTQRSTQNLKRYPFLNNTSIDLNDDDILTLNESLNRGTPTQLSISSPSRLQRIKISRFESAQKPLALDLNPSEPYIVSTEPENIPASEQLERDSSLISINFEEDISDQIQMKSSLTSRAPTTADLSEMSKEVSMTSRHQPVSIKEVRNQIWNYCHSTQVKEQTKPIKTENLDAKIETQTGKIVVNQSPGKKRLIKIIHKVADESKADFCEKVPEMKVDMIENTFTARSFAKYLDEKDIKVPSYLSPNEKVL